MSNLCNVNGEIVPEEDAKIPVLDRGFLFGDSVYEVIRTRGGVPFGWPEHLARLHRSAAGLAMDLGITDGELTRRITATIAAAANADNYVRIIITRGVGSAPNIDVRYAADTPTCVIMVRPLGDNLSSPATVAIVPRLRMDRRALDPAIKSGNYLNNVMGLQEAQAQGATDCLFLNADGKLTEASTSNVWICVGESIRTPPLSAGLLAGVTRSLLFQMCAEAGISCEEKDLHLQDVESADGMFLTSTLRDIALVTAVNGKPCPENPWLLELQAKFQAWCDHRAATSDQASIDALCAQP